MLLLLSLLLTIFWAIGFGLYHFGALIHLLLLVAIGCVCAYFIIQAEKS